MVKNNEKLEDPEDLMTKALESLSTSTDDYIERRIHHINFAKIIFWMCVKSRNENMFYQKDLRKFIRLDDSRLFNILRGLKEIGIIRSDHISNNQLSYFFIKEGGLPLVSKYFEKAKKTLGVKVEISFKRSEEMGDEFI